MEIPSSLRLWFVADFVVSLAAALPLLLIPELALPRLGWTVVDPVSARLVGAALAAIGIQSWRGRRDGVAAYRAMLGLKVVWSALAIVGLTIAIARGAPPLTFLFLSAFLGFCGVWTHYAVRFRQQARAATDAGASDGDPDDEGAAPDADLGAAAAPEA